MDIEDNGIGIFQKIKRDLGLDYSKQALLELAKGKFTSDPENHSGEGIFFTSRAFDMFYIFSHKLTFGGIGNENGLIIDVKDDWPGTVVILKIKKNAL